MRQVRPLVLVAAVIGIVGSPLLGAEATRQDPSLASEAAQPFDPTRTSVAVLQEVFRHRRQPWEQSRLRPFLPRVSILAGAGEKVLNTFMEENGNRLGFLLTALEQPSRNNDNPYVDMTKELVAGESLETQLARRIASSPGNLTPDRVLGMALETADGDYWLAMLTAHNMLKEVTYAERTQRAAVLGWDGEQPLAGSTWVQIDPAEVTSKLRNLRQPYDQFASDKMGPWYHMYGLLFVGSVTSGAEAEALATTENLTRRLGLGSDRDPFKEEMNRWAAGLSYLVNEAVDIDIYVPENLEELSPEELESARNRLIELHRERQEELERTTEMVTDEHWGPMMEWNREVLRRLQSAFYNESDRIRQQLERLAAPPPPAVPVAPPPAVLVLSVVDADENTPVAGVSVRLEGPSARRADGPAGWVSLESLAPGSYRIVVSAPGYEPRSGGLELSSGSTARETVRMRRVVTSGMRIEIVDADSGRGVVGFTVRVQGEDSWADSDRDGVLVIGDLPVGEHILEVSAEGYETLRGSIRLEAGRSISRTFPLQPVARPAQLAMTIVDAVTGNRIPYALLRYEGPESGSVTAGVDGTLSFQVPGGTYRVRLFADGYEAQSENLSVSSGQTYGGDVGMYPLTAPPPPPEPKPDDRTESRPTSDSDCPPEVLAQAQSYLEHNAAQNPAGSVYIRSMGMVQSCVDARIACDAQAKAVADRCRPDSSGSYAACQTEERASNLRCSNQEIRCTMSALSCRDPGTDPRLPQPEADGGRCTPELRKQGSDYLEHNAAQNPAGSVYIRSMGMVQRCIDARIACDARAKAVADRCRPDSNGSYAACQTEERASNLRCSNEEIRCTLSDLGCR